MKCSNCGADVKENTRFCEVCGQPVEQSSFTGSGEMGSATGKSTKKSKMPLFIGLAVLLVAVIGIVAFAIPKFKQGMMKPADFMQYVEQKDRDKGADDIGKYFGLAKKSFDLTNGSRKGSFQVEITDDAKNLINQYVTSYAALYGIQVPNLSKLKDITLEVQTETKDNTSLFQYILKLNDESFLTMKMCMDTEGKKLYYQIPELSSAYLDSSSAMEQAWDDSPVFSMEYLKGLQTGEYLPDAKTAEDIVKRYTDILIKSIQNVEKKQDQTCEADGVSKKTDLYTASYDGKDASALVKEFITTLKEDKELLSYAEKLGAKQDDITSSLDDAIKEYENLKGKMTFSDYVSDEEIMGREIRFFEETEDKEPELVIQMLTPKDGEKLGFLFYVEHKSQEILKISGHGVLKNSIFDGEFSAESPFLMEQAGQMASGEVIHVNVAGFDVTKAETAGNGEFEITVPGIAELAAFKVKAKTSGTIEDMKEAFEVYMGEQKLCILNLSSSKGEALDVHEPGAGDTVYDVTDEQGIMQYASEMDTLGIVERIKEISGIDLKPLLGDMLTSLADLQG